jgi:hypothetical protein
MVHVHQNMSVPSLAVNFCKKMFVETLHVKNKQTKNKNKNKKNKKTKKTIEWSRLNSRMILYVSSIHVLVP